MTTDKTSNYEATQRFLDRRLVDAATVGKATNEVLQIAEFGAKSVFGIIASVSVASREVLFVVRYFLKLKS